MGTDQKRSGDGRGRVNYPQGPEGPAEIPSCGLGSGVQGQATWLEGGGWCKKRACRWSALTDCGQVSQVPWRDWPSPGLEPVWVTAQPPVDKGTLQGGARLWLRRHCCCELPPGTLPPPQFLDSASPCGGRQVYFLCRPLGRLPNRT